MQGLMILVLSLMAGSSNAWADDKPDMKKDLQVCNEQLLTTKVKAQNLDEQRDRATQEKSQLQVQVYRLQQELAAVKKELEEKKK